ncbi:MAG TPA: hypothetical protein VKU94_00695 [Geobacterales bacterium]|nr:hypothetical protein [Geobacterales bacterium]
MEFCPKCNNLMVPKKTKKGIKLVCTNCGYSKTAKKVDIKLITKSTNKKSKEIAITTPEEVKAREEEKLMLEELYKDSLEYFETD